MKASLAVLSSVFLLSAPVLAHAGQDVLKASLVQLTRQEMSVAPWVGISVTEEVRGDKLIWAATTGGGQRYACSAPANADAVLAGAVSCVRLGAVQTKRANNVAQLAAMSRRERIFPVPGDTVYAYTDTHTALR